jgi:hypothetical protein
MVKYMKTRNKETQIIEIKETDYGKVPDLYYII